MTLSPEQRAEQDAMGRSMDRADRLRAEEIVALRERIAQCSDYVTRHQLERRLTRLLDMPCANN